MDWEHFVGGFFQQTSMPSERTLAYLAALQELEPDLVVSDYNLSAASAALIGGYSHVLVTERYDYTLCQCYLEAFTLLRRHDPDLYLVLITRGPRYHADHVICTSYVPDWCALLRGAQLLISAPGWITVTEVATLGVPTVFVLASHREFHESEAQERLARLGYPTLVGTDPVRTAELARRAMNDPTVRTRMTSAAAAIAHPDGRGAERAADLLLHALDSCPRGHAKVPAHSDQEA